MEKTMRIALLLLFLAPLYAVAQVGLLVSTTTSQNNGISGIPVLLENTRLGLRDSVVTDSRGQARFTGLTTTSGWRVSALGNDDFQQTNSVAVVLRANTISTVQLVLRPVKSASTEGVVVTATSINTIDAEVSAQLSEATLRALPVEGRDITRALFRLPNVSQATGFFTEAPNVSINGANSLYTSYLIDGMDNNENFLGGQRFAMPVGFTQNISVLTNNFSVEYGNTANGVVNITTKSGSNTVEGEVFYLTRPGKITDGTSQFAQRDLSGNQVKDGFMRQQFGAGIGGAVVKDQTFFYVNLEQTFDVKDNLLTSPALGINATVPGQNSFTYASLKLDHHWNTDWQTSLRANLGATIIDFQGGGLTGGASFPSAGYTQNRDALNIALKNLYRGSTWLSETDVLYGTFDWNYANPLNPDDPQVIVQDPTGATAAILGGPGFTFQNIETTLQVQQKITLLWNNHTVKIGAGIKNSAFQLFGGGDPQGQYVVRLNEAQANAIRSQNRGAALGVRDIPLDVQVLNYNVELHPEQFSKTQQIISAFAEDVIAVSPELNVSIGLRWDYDNLSMGGSTSGDMNNIAPRVSANYKLTPSSSLSIGAGQFYDKILYALYSDARQFSSTGTGYRAQLQALKDRGLLPANTSIDAITNDGNFAASVPNVTYLNGPSGSQFQNQRQQAFSNELRILNPNGYANPYANQFSMGYQSQLTETLHLTANVMYNRSYNLFRIRNLNAPAPFNVDPNNVRPRSTIEADASRILPITNVIDSAGRVVDRFWINGNDTLRGVARNIVMTESSGESEYAALTVVLHQDRGNTDFAWRATYTLSSLMNNTEDINFRAEDANRYDREWAPSVNDRTHIINAFGSWYCTDKLVFTVAALLQSGQPINRVADAAAFGTNDLNGDGSAFGDAYQGNTDRSPGESRNSDRLPWATTIDLAAQYTFPLFGSNNIELRLDVFNALNANNLSGYSNNATQSNQIQTGSLASGLLVRRNSAPPRQVQFGIRYIF
jgi:hypothetical protein